MNSGTLWLLFFAALGVALIWAFYKRYKALKNYDPANDSDKLVILTDQNFQKTISKGVTLVDFWAEWCTACIAQDQVYEEIAGKFGNQIRIAKINVIDNRVLSDKFGVRNIPFLILLKEGKPILQMPGIQSKEYLFSQIEKQITT